MRMIYITGDDLTPKAEVRIKVDKMLFDVCSSVHKRVEHLLNSGALNMEDWEDNFLLPKALLSDALHEVAANYDHTGNDSLYSKEQKAQIKNLRHF